MRRARLAVASLAAVATFATSDYSCRAADELKVAVGGRGIGETFVTEVGDKAGLFKRHNLALDIFYTDGGGETQQAVISNSAQVGIASGFLGAIGVFAKGGTGAYHRRLVYRRRPGLLVRAGRPAHPRSAGSRG